VIGRSYQRVLEDEFSSARASRHVAELGQWFRSPGSSGYHAAIDYVLSALAEGGVRSEEMSFELGGGARVGDEETPLGWEPRSAELHLVRPKAAKVATYEGTTSAIPWWTPPTPAGGVELGLVDVGTGLSDDDYAGRDVSGRAVLVADSAENFAWLDIVDRAERHGAAAILTDYLLYQFEPWRTRASLQEAVQQLRLRPKHGNPWAMSLSATAFQQLLAAAAADPGAAVRLEIDSALFEGTSRSVLATVGDAPPGERHIIFVAHVTAATKPGANCASGVALLVELAAAIERATGSGRLPPLRRNIHFLFGNEDLASLALAAERPEMVERALGAVSVCSVAHAQGETKSALVLSRSPDALPTYLNDLSAALIDSAQGELSWPYRHGRPELPIVNWKPVPYTPWSDNVTWTRMGVPALLCMSLPDRFFHTQLLTPDKTDRRAFRQAASVLGSAALASALAGPGETEGLMRLVASGGMARLARTAVEALAATDPPGPDAAERIRYLAERDVADLRSALALLDTASDAERDAAAAVARELEGELRLHAEAALRMLGASGPAAEDAGDDEPVPSRTDRAPHGLAGLSHPEALELVARIQRRDSTFKLESLQLLVDELWRLSDGERSIARIAVIVRNEFEFRIEVEDMRTLADALENAGCLRLDGSATTRPVQPAGA
jgi:aminopeptidase YwaD